MSTILCAMCLCKLNNLIVKQSVQICIFLNHKVAQDIDGIISTTVKRHRRTEGIMGGVSGAKLYTVYHCISCSISLFSTRDIIRELDRIFYIAVVSSEWLYFKTIIGFISAYSLTFGWLNQ